MIAVHAINGIAVINDIIYIPGGSITQGGDSNSGPGQGVPPPAVDVLSRGSVGPRRASASRRVALRRSLGLLTRSRPSQYDQREADQDGTASGHL